MVFYGEYIGMITSGGRVALPKKIREILTRNHVVLTKGFGLCLAGYDKQDWERRAESLLDVSLIDKEQIDKRRVLFSSTEYLELDDQGRVVLPKNLLEFAELEKEVKIIGVGDHFEIWNTKKLEAYLQEVNKS